MPWKILLGDADRALAEARIAEITAAVSPETVDHPGLAGGTAGIALLLGTLARTNGDWKRTEELVETAIEAVGQTVLGPSLYSGFAGVAWLVDHLAGEDAEDSNEDIDAALLEHLEVTPWRGDYDLINGLVGFGVYALERVRRWRAPSAIALLERVVSRLEELAVEAPGSPGRTYWTSPDLMIAETAARSPQGNYNLGLAHGVPGVIALLGATLEAEVAGSRVRPLLDSVVTWLLAQRSPSPEGTQYGYSIEIPPIAEAGRSRTAWCYGDPGVAVALLWAGQCAGRKDWITAAIEIGRSAANRRPDECGVVDAGLCHGAAGLALIYNRMWQATGDDLFAEAARRWVRRTLEMYEPGEGHGGYRSWMPTFGTEPAGWRADPGVLTGAAGVALGLHACATAQEPTWDVFLLTSAKGGWELVAGSHQTRAC